MSPSLSKFLPVIHIHLPSFPAASESSIPIFDSRHSHPTSWPVHTPIQSRTELMIGHPFTHGPQRHTLRFVDVWIPHPLPILFISVLSFCEYGSHSSETVSSKSNTSTQIFLLPPTSQCQHLFGVVLLVHHRNSGLGSTSSSMTSTR